MTEGAAGTQVGCSAARGATSPRHWRSSIRQCDNIGEHKGTQFIVSELLDVWLLDLVRGVTSRFTFDPNGDGVRFGRPRARGSYSRQALFKTGTGAGSIQPGVGDHVRADGQRFLVGTLVGEANAAPVNVIVNWTTELAADRGPQRVSGSRRAAMRYNRFAVAR